jgi:hypothetical protein
MKKDVVLIVLGGFLFASALLLFQRYHTPPLTSPAPVAANRPAVDEQSLVATAQPPAKGRNYTETHVNWERINTDHDYALRVGKHRVIKAYLASPLKGKAEFEPVLDWMIQHGYGIEDLQIIWTEAQSVVQNMQTYDEIEASLRKTPGPKRPEAEIAFSARAFLYQQEPLAKEHLRLAAGLRYSEEEALENLWIFAKQVPHSLDRWGPWAEAEEGETLLTDDDWMSPQRKKLKAEYTGPERHSILSEANPDGFRPPPSLVLTPEEQEIANQALIAKVAADKARRGQ